MTLRFIPGVVPNDPTKKRLRFESFRREDTAIPVSVDYTRFPTVGMLGNDQYGDCVEAGNGHIVEQQTYIGQNAEAVVSTANVLAEYSQITGFNQDDPSTDNGTMIQDGLNDLRRNGLPAVVNGVVAAHKIAAFAQLDPSNLNDVKLAVAEFGAVSIGFDFPSSAMQQFNAGQPWDVVSGSPIEGGHCVIVMGYDANYLYVITWGAVQKMTYAFWNKYVTEAWAVIDQEWVNRASGRDVEGVDLQAFGQQFADLTGEPNPFPAPAPPPGPDPGPAPPAPEPGPPHSPDAAEIDLAAALHRYLGLSKWRRLRYLDKAARAWLIDKGFGLKAGSAIFYPDISSFQSGISLRGALAVSCKATEGTTYVNPDYAPAKARAAQSGTFFFAYHFLHAGNAAAQAQHCFNVVGKNVPLMLDVEFTLAGPLRSRRSHVDLPAGVASNPGIGDVTAFIDAYRRLGGKIYLVYLPHWYWQDHIGSPSLAPLVSRGMLLVSSNYSGFSTGAGWVPYGGMTPVVWQYSDRIRFNGFSVDFNAFRGPLSDFRSLVTTGKLPVPPVRPSGPVRHTADGHTSMNAAAKAHRMNVQELIAVSFENLSELNKLRLARYLAYPGRRKPMPKGLVYWTD